MAPLARVGCSGWQYKRGPAKYTGRYDDSVLGDWAEWLAAQMRQGRQVFAYFNNDAGGHAPRDAIRLRRAISHSYSACLKP
jgi:uncharacterized protein YecE (DUF72 family)